MTRRSAFFLALAAGLAMAGAVRAQETEGLLSGTLKKVRDRGTILIGYRTGAVPFSFLNRGGQPVGFSVEICRGIASDIAARLHRDLLEPDAAVWQTGIRLVFVPLSAEARLPKVTAGEVDLECGSTTATDERRKSVAFSPVFFLAGTKIMGRDGNGVSSYRDLAGRKLAVGAGTTNAEVVRRLAVKVSPPIEVQEVASAEAAVEALASGKADAAASDDILLYGLKASRPDGDSFTIEGDYLSFEPYAIMFRKDDPDLAELVGQSFARMARDSILSSSYERWFLKPLPTGAELGLPMSSYLAEIYRALGQPD
ncbi:amino acid ABC transporter substrate-binding protein [Hansschlegelia quercus]|uniref:Amino acid ABC transporter substrate-binding protein n=1 Tax=Hansschlegelia quercus TaxID=2528245 RepID=A0A4Q9GHC4_9HYPH|nr:amino acid ABC transporter substrate-binding protein [Hansschlegelia quercus]TBN53569.1 amino acid ABC transporter substrate-binding protein [Hansschlegelia quercus]